MAGVHSNMQGTAPAAADLHLCNNYRHLLIALASIAADTRPATIVYLEDDLPIAPLMRQRVAAAVPQAEVIYTRDAVQIAAFSNLSAALPAILRRNLRFGGPFGVQRAQGWVPPVLAGRRFATGYIYHSGFFLAKPAAALCDHVVMRESGLNNFVTLRVPPLKALIRLCLGLPPRQQVWGEERWIDEIQVSRPDDLPVRVRGKARRLTFTDVLDRLPAETARRIAAAFIGDVPLSPAPPRSALLLTQPISLIKICSTDEQRQVYATISYRLQAAGYAVYVKPHPLDDVTALPGASVLPASFPIEAWPYFSDHTFRLAVALCSASLSGGARPFAQTEVQLLDAAVFNAAGVPQWPALIDRALAKALAQPFDDGTAISRPPP